MADTMSTNPCRICMGSKMNQSSIFSNDLSRKVTEIADVEVQEGDGLPPTICKDCELDLEKCYKFREQIQWADSKFRENISATEVVFEECQIKQEVGPMHPFINEEDNQDQNDEDDDDDRGPSDNDEDYEMQEEPEDKTERAEKEGNEATHPLDHVEIIEHRTKQEIHMSSTDQNSQDEPLIVTQNMKNENEPTTDPLMHNETQSMETDNSVPGPSTSTPMVCGTEKSKSCANWRPSVNNSEPGTSIDAVPTIQPKLRERLARKPAEPGFVEMQTSINEFGHFMTQSQYAAAGPSIPHVPSLNPEECINTMEGFAEDKPLKEDLSPKRRKKRENSSSSESDKKRVVTKRVTRKKSLTKTKSQSKPAKTAKMDKQFKANDETSCFVCNINLYDHELLLEHFNNRQFYCRVCTKEFDNHSNLLIHFTTHRAYNCKNCSDIFYCKKDYLDHKKNSETCSSSLVKCEICEAIMEKRSLRGHKLQTHFGDTGAFKCIVCTKSFSLAHMLTDHLKKVHIAYEYMECTHCHKFILGPEKLKHHVRMNHVQSAESNTSFVCPVCSKVFTRENILKIHLNKHNDNTESLCEDCGKSIVGKAAMKEHKRYEHSKDEVFVCCHQKFDSYKSFRSHQRSHYRDTKKDQPAFCDLCGKQFKNASILKQHIQIHSDERAYKCDVCGATFKQKVALYTHSRIHSETNKYVCATCGQTFRWKQTFDKHVKKCGMPHTHHHHHYCSGTSDYLNL